MPLYDELSGQQSPLPPVGPAAPAPAPAQASPHVSPVLASPAALPEGLPAGARRFGDPRATRQAIYESVLAAAQQVKPVENTRYALSLHDVDWRDPESHGLRAQKKAVLEGKTLSRRLQGTWRLTDKSTGKAVDERRMTLASAPYYTNRGTFILNGIEYNLAHQMRLLPGVFTRVKDSGELESHINIMPGKGASHRYFMDPEDGVFRMSLGQARVPLISVLRAAGATDSELRDTWGGELFNQNAKAADPRVIDKLYARLVRRADPKASHEVKAKALAETLASMEVDPAVTALTLGHPHKHLDKSAMLAITKKLLSVSRGEADPDDRDHLAFQHFLGPEELLSERIHRDRGSLQQLLWKATNLGNLSRVLPGVFTRHIEAGILDSGLGNSAEEINPLEMYDGQFRTSRMGVGGIPSIDSVPDEARAVQPSQMGYVDLLRTPESLKAGVDTRVARSAYKGRDGRIYAPFKDPRTGKTIYKSPVDLLNATIAFPGEVERARLRGDDMVTAMVRGKTSMVPLDRVDLAFSHMEDAFSPVTNMVPLKSTVKGQRVSMGSRFILQSVALKEPEAPLVRGKLPEGNASWEEDAGQHAGAVRAPKGGRVLKVTPDEIQVQYDDGTKETHDLYENFVFNRKSLLHNTPTVKPGDRFNPGHLLAKSNYTDDQGHVALGKNLRVAYIAKGGENYEDAFSISESAARKMTSEHAYQNVLDWDKAHKRGKKNYLGIFPARFDRAVMDTIDDDGFVKPGTVVKPGDPLILAARERELNHRQVHSAHKGSFADASVTWDHHADGVVTDVAKTDKGVNVVVKSYNPMQVGDKLCFDEQTEALTKQGWKPVADLTMSDEICCLVDEEVVYQRPTALHRYDTGGRMYRIKSQQVDLFVTDSHRMYVKGRDKADFELVEAGKLFGKRVSYKKNGVWRGQDPDAVIFPAVRVVAGRAGRGSRVMPEIRLEPKTYAMLLGAFLSEGSVVDHPESGSYGISIAQTRQDEKHMGRLVEALDRLGISYSFFGNKTAVRIYGKQLLAHFQQFGKSSQKYIPDEVFSWTRETLEVLFDWLMWGDGHSSDLPVCYTTTSPRLADDVQRLCLHIGKAANVINDAPAGIQTIKGKEYYCQARYSVRIVNTKLTPSVNHGHVKKQKTQEEYFVDDYQSAVYCVTVPSHVLYVRRNGIPVWSGNSGKYGDKGVISAIIPDDQMPHDENGQPYDVLANPLGVISRCYDAQTRFITQEGAKFGNDVQPEDKLLCYVPATDSLMFLPQTSRFHAADYVGEMIRYQDNLVSFCVTPNHSMLVRERSHWGTYEVETAGALCGRDCIVPTAHIDGEFRFGEQPLATEAPLSAANWHRVHYSGRIYCPTVPTGYVVTQRDGKYLVAGNTNPSQVLEAVLGKIAAKTGKPYIVEDFDHKIDDMTDWVEKEAARHGVSDLETVIDPTTGRKIPNVLTGVRHYLKLHHLSESKGSGRGLGAVTAEGVPARGGPQGCFTAVQRVMTIDGPMEIGRICEKRLGVQVRTFDFETRTWTYRPVTDWFVYRSPVSQLLTIKTSDGRALYVTRNHELYRPDGSKVLAGSVKVGDSLATWGPVPTAEQWAFLFGSMLGDASTNVSQFSCEHSVKQVAYLNWKQRILSRLEGICYTRDGVEGNGRVGQIDNEPVHSGPSRVVSVGARHVFERLTAVCYSGPNRKKTVTREWLERLTGLSVVAWLLDDGSITNRAKKRGKVSMTGQIATQGFDRASVEMLADWLRARYDQPCTVMKNDAISLSAEMCRVLIHEVAEWIPWRDIPKSKRFLRDRVQELQSVTPPRVIDGDSVLGLIELRVKSVEPYEHPVPGVAEVNVYDFTVEKTHNYCAGHALVSNSKKVAIMDAHALLSYGALNVLKDAKLIRGAANPEYWSTTMAGFKPATPDVPVMWEKFVASLKAAGSNVVRNGNTFNLMEMTRKAVQEHAGDRELENIETVDWQNGMKPIKGGLFDPTLTGGHGGRRWAKISLPEPMLNPVMEEPARRLLGLTQAKLEDVIAGREELNGVRGPAAIQKALEGINIEKEIASARADVASGRKSLRDSAVRKLKYLKAAQAKGIHPGEWVLDAMPVLPPWFRPVSMMQGNRGQLISDVNYLYKELFDAREAFKQLHGRVDDLSDERLNIYNTMKAVTGLGDPTQPKNVERKVRGLLASIFGSSPKHSVVQQKLLGSSVNLVGRGVIAPDADLNMDEVSIPENQAWEVYSPFIVRNLVRRGVGRSQALMYLKDRHEMARKAMVDEMEARPVILTRAPVLHRFGNVALWPKLTAGDTIMINPFIVGGLGADFDGDASNFHVPATDEAREEAIEKMLPSKNLTAINDLRSPMFAPRQEYQGGLYTLTSRENKEKRPRVFATRADLLRAWENGELEPSDPVTVIQDR